MARRRAIGRGFDAAGSLIELFIKDKMDRARQQSQQEMIAARERQSQIIGALASGNFSKLRPDYQTAFNEFANTDLPVNSNEQILNQSIAGFTDADTRSKLPTKEEAVAGVRQAGGMLKTGEDALALLNARSARDEQLKNAEPPTRVEGMITDATGEAVKGARYERPSDLAGQAFSTERTAEQEGQRKGRESVSQLQVPGALKAVEDQAYATNRGANRSDYLDDDVYQRKVQLAEAQAEASAGNRAIRKDEYDSAAYANRMENAEGTFSELAGEITKMDLPSFALQGMAPATFQSPTMQKYMQAARNFINAQLRRESGAVISASEFSEARQQYLPQPGDTPDVLEMKRQNRQIVREGNIRGAGRAYVPYRATQPAPAGGPTSTTQSLFPPQ